MSWWRRRRAKIRLKIAFENYFVWKRSSVGGRAERGKEERKVSRAGREAEEDQTSSTSSRKKYVCGACVRVIQGTTTT